MLLSCKYRIGTNRMQSAAHPDMLKDFCRLYNAGLEQRIDGWRRRRISGLSASIREALQGNARNAAKREGLTSEPADADESGLDERLEFHKAEQRDGALTAMPDRTLVCVSRASLLRAEARNAKPLCIDFTGGNDKGKRRPPSSAPTSRPDLFRCR